MKKTLIIIIVVGLLLLISGKIIMRYNNDNSDLAFTNVEKETINKEFDDVKKIDLVLGFYSIVIEEDSNIKNVQLTMKNPIIKSDGADINKIECKNGTLTISQKHEKTLAWEGNFDFEKQKGELFIKIPSKNKLSNINIINGIGSIKINNISTESLEVNSGTSTVDIKGIDVNNCHISSGTGSTNLYDVSIDKIKIESGTGRVFLNGDIRKKIDISTGTGRIELELEGKEKDYSYDIEANLGKIQINKSIYKKEIYLNNKSSYCDIELNTGTGSVKIETR